MKYRNLSCFRFSDERKKVLEIARLLLSGMKVEVRQRKEEKDVHPWYEDRNETEKGGKKTFIRGMKIKWRQEEGGKDVHPWYEDRMETEKGRKRCSSVI